MTNNEIIYECHKCGKTFKYKNDRDRHLNKKIPCLNNEKEQYKIQKKTCNFCGKMYTRSDSVLRHLETCEKKLDNDKKIREQEEKKIIMENLLKQMSEMKENQQTKDNEMREKIRSEMMKEMQEMKQSQQKKEKAMQKQLDNLKEQLAASLAAHNSNSSKNINVGNNVNSHNNIQNNIHNEIKIIAYGKEDISYITDNDYQILIHKGFKSVPNLVEYIHFNGDKPENQNIYISNMRDNYILVYDGEEWQMREREDVLQDMIDNKTDILNEKFDELLDKLDDITIKRFKKFLNEKDDDKISSQLKKDLKLILYNRKKVTNVKPRYIGAAKSKEESSNKTVDEPPKLELKLEQKIEQKIEQKNIEVDDTKLSTFETKSESEPEIVIKTYKTTKKTK